MDNRIIKEIKKDNISVKIETDTWESPRTFYKNSNLGNMICFHSKYDIGDDHDFENVDDLFTNLLAEFLDKEIIIYCLSNRFKNFSIEKKQDNYWVKTYDNKRQIKEVFESDDISYIIELINNNIENTEIIKFLESKDWVILPIYIYDHSLQTISTTPFNCRWDSGLLGYIYTSEYEGINKEMAKKELESEIKLYNDYMNDNIYFCDLYKDNEIKDSDGRFFLSEHESFQDMVISMLDNLKLSHLLEEGEIVYDV